MEENNVKEPDSVLNKDGKEFKTVKPNNERNTKQINFGKQILTPFVSGVLGAGLVLGICLGVPEIRSGLLNSAIKHNTIIARRLFRNRNISGTKSIAINSRNKSRISSKFNIYATTKYSDSRRFRNYNKWRWIYINK